MRNPDGSRTRRIRVIASDVRALLVERCLANDDTTLVNFDLLDRLTVSKDPSGELDVVDVATADAWSVDGKRLNLAGLGRTEFDVIDFD